MLVQWSGLYRPAFLLILVEAESRTPGFPGCTPSELGSNSSTGAREALDNHKVTHGWKGQRHPTTMLFAASQPEEGKQRMDMKLFGMTA